VSETPPDDPVAGDREIAELYLRTSDMPPEVARQLLVSVCSGKEPVRARVDELIQLNHVPSAEISEVANAPESAQIADILAAVLQVSALGQPPELARFVPSSGERLRERILVELIKLDQKWRWSVRQPKPLEVYLDEWPELRARRALLVELLSSECLARSVYAAPASKEELLLRFPEVGPLVRIDMLEKRAAAVTQALRATPTSPAFTVPDRFTLIRKIGEGGMGVVYEALDRQRATPVALKTLPRMEAVALYRFKREFRTLAGIAHPNLVPLYELVSDGNVWFFTMEMIEGCDFISYVQGARVSAALHKERSETSTVILPLEARATKSRPRSFPLGDTSALRSALRQLVEGVMALHAAHILHRDLKPSNVLVRDDGRVVILDVGVAKPLGAADPAARGRTSPVGLPSGPETWTRDEDIVGSVLYMSPEQAAAGPLTEASDWYSVGVILYEALTGELPFVGNSIDVIMRKRVEDIAPPNTLAPGVPDDLNDLCVALLRREARDRPSGREVLARLSPGDTSADTSVATPRPVTFVGRESSLAMLTAAYRELENRRAVTVHIRGRSGAGKTALAQRFLSTLPDEAVVLSGRCYEQESVPYKALDSIVDDLSRRLMSLRTAEIRPLIPADVAALARVFPVLERVDAVSDAARGRPEIPDVGELRRRAFGALGDMLRRMGAAAPLVMVIDDLQWGDVDSASLLISLLGAAEPPRLLLIACYRTEFAERNPCLVALNAARARQVCFEVEVDPLSFDEAERLAAILLGRSHAGSGAARRIARESGGNPYFVYELAHQTVLSREEVADTATRGLDLDEALWRRVMGLHPPARHLLEVLAVAGKPLPLRTACEAADLGLQARGAAATLHAERLIRTTGPGFDDVIETYHDRIRESVSNHLHLAARTEHHRKLAQALEASSNTDIEATAWHFHRAGLLEKAGQQYAVAADKAAAALAFDRSAELYGLALSLGSVPGDSAQLLRSKRGDALANAGRGFEAGQEYQRAAEGASEHRVIELQRKAGYQYFVSGHIDEGRQAFETVLARFGKRLPRTRRQALLSLLLRRLRLRLRGMGFHERSEAEVPPDELERVDIFWSVAAGMTIADPIRGAEYQTYDLILALQAGEPYRIARALAWEAAHISMIGVRLKRRADEELAAADELAARINRPQASGMTRMSRGVAAYFHGDFVQCQRLCEEAAQIFRDHCTGVSWELETCNAFAFWPLYFRGEYGELSRRFATLIAEVRQRGARLAEADLTTFGGPFVWLAADDPDGAQRAMSSVMGEWSRQDFQVQHFTTLTAEAQIDLYRGDGRAAWDRVSRDWAGVADAMLLHVEIVRIYMLHLRARCALAAVANGGDRDRLLRSAARDASRLERERPPYARALARTIRAALAAERGDRETAVGLLGSVADELDRLSWGCFGAGARRRYGELLGGEAGRRIVQSVDDALSAQGVKRPDLIAALQAPGFARS
jgi:serine/threonine protein kinase/predicted ATPase